MNQTTKINPAPSHAMDDEMMDQMKNNEVTGTLAHTPLPEYLTDAEILDDELSFVLSEN